MKGTYLAIVIAGLTATISATVAFLHTRPAAAQEAFAGSWDVINAQPAPWVGEGKPYLNEEIVRGRITFMADSVQGPAFLNCDEANYQLLKVPPEGLFQGALSDPQSQAKGLGFKEGEITQLRMQCASGNADIEMDFDLVSEDTAVFAADNIIYTMRRVNP